MPDETNHQLRYKHAGNHQRGVDDAKRYDAHAFDPVQGALQSTEALECVEVKQERNADDDDVLPDSPLLPLQVDVCWALPATAARLRNLLHGRKSPDCRMLWRIRRQQVMLNRLPVTK